METRNKTLNLFKTQVDGCDDDMIDEVEQTEHGHVNNNYLAERIQVRNELLKRKLEMEDEMEHLQKRARFLQDKREVNYLISIARSHLVKMSDY